jgi:hypothetical protein
MKPCIAWLAALSLASLPAVAQEHRDDRHEGARPNQQIGHGYVPSRGPSPVRNAPPVVRHEANPPVVQHGQPDPRHHAFRDQPQHPETPHVHPGDQWVGHSSGRGDPRYHLERPWAHGHFTGGFGPRYVYRLRGGGFERFSLDGQFFAVAPSDQELCADWDWNDDDIVLYADPDHDGFYLAYNPRLGTYAHVEYLGG